MVKLLFLLFFPINVFCMNLIIEDIKMRTFPVELIAVLIKDIDTDRKVVYILEYIEFEEIPDLKRIVKNNKKIPFKDAVNCFPEKYLDKDFYGF